MKKRMLQGDDGDKERARPNEAEEGRAMSQALLPLKQRSRPNGESALPHGQSLHQLRDSSSHILKYSVVPDTRAHFGTGLNRGTHIVAYTGQEEGAGLVIQQER